MEIKLDKDFWNKRYLESDTAWDLGKISPPLKEYFDKIENKELKILIPGAGNAHEAEYLFHKGFKQIYILDIALEAIKNFKKRVPEFPDEHLICGDFFEHHNTYDLIIEQTFFCAIHPSLRKEYALKIHELLKTNGKLVGLLFDDKLNDDKPPFGGSKAEYLNLFSAHFNIKQIETANNSISPRATRELFIIFEKN